MKCIRNIASDVKAKMAIMSRLGCDIISTFAYKSWEANLAFNAGKLLDSSLRREKVSLAQQMNFVRFVSKVVNKGKKLGSSAKSASLTLNVEETRKLAREALKSRFDERFGRESGKSWINIPADNILNWPESLPRNVSLWGRKELGYPSPVRVDVKALAS